MRKIIATLGILLTVTACTDSYGRVDPVATGLAVGVGALAVGALGYAAGQNGASVYRAPSYYAPRYGHHHSPYYGGYGYR